MTTSPCLQVKSLSIDIKQRHVYSRVVNQVSFDVHAGQCLGLVGESGSGKSTLLHIAGALELPDKGSVEIAGKELSKMDDTGRAAVRRKDIAIIFQHFNLIPSLNVAANINFQANLSGPVDKIKLEKKQPHEFTSSTIKPSGTINADTLSTLLRDPIYNIERAKGFFKDNRGEVFTIQYDGLTLEIKKTENEKDPVFVVIGKKNFYNEKEFVEKLNSIQT